MQHFKIFRLYISCLEVVIIAKLKHREYNTNAFTYMVTFVPMEIGLKSLT
jgi:hypothetical protein